MPDPTPGAVQRGGPAPEGLTDAEKLAALDTYIAILTDQSKALRVAVTEDMGVRKVEKVGAFLPDGTKLASVSRSGGKKSVKVTDDRAFLKWCMIRYPGEIVSAINPAFVAKILNAASGQEVGSNGVDPATGELLPFIEVQQGAPYVSITKTTEGRNRMAQLAGGFVGMLESGQA